MILGKIIGNVVAAAKHNAFHGQRVLIVQPIETDGSNKGSSFLACDAAQAGPGDVVLVAREGNTARELLGDMQAPFHAVILGVVDKVKTGEK